MELKRIQLITAIGEYFMLIGHNVKMAQETSYAVSLSLRILLHPHHIPPK